MGSEPGSLWRRQRQRSRPESSGREAQRVIRRRFREDQPADRSGTRCGPYVLRGWIRWRSRRAFRIARNVPGWRRRQRSRRRRPRRRRGVPWRRWQSRRRRRQVSIARSRRHLYRTHRLFFPYGPLVTGALFLCPPQLSPPDIDNRPLCIGIPFSRRTFVVTPAICGEAQDLA
jgi:hypothetical protein